MNFAIIKHCRSYPYISRQHETELIVWFSNPWSGRMYATYQKRLPLCFYSLWNLVLTKRCQWRSYICLLFNFRKLTQGYAMFWTMFRTFIDVIWYPLIGPLSCSIKMFIISCENHHCLVTWTSQISTCVRHDYFTMGYSSIKVMPLMKSFTFPWWIPLTKAIERNLVFSLICV